MEAAEVSSLLDELGRQAESVRRYQGLVGVRGRGPDGGFDARLAVFFERPDRLRVELLGAFGGTRWSAVASREEQFARQVLERIPPARRAVVVESLGELLAAVRGATEECCPGAFDHLMTEFGAGGEQETGASAVGCGPACGCGPAETKGAGR